MGSEQKSHADKTLPENAVIYRDEDCTLEIAQGQAYFYTNGRRYSLSSQPYEPCTYLIDEKGSCSVIHNAFDIYRSLEILFSGRTLHSISGVVYDMPAFCRLLRQAAKYAGSDVDIDYLESLQLIDEIRARGAVGKDTARDPVALGIAGSKFLPRLLHAKKLGRTPDGCYYVR